METRTFSYFKDFMVISVDDPGTNRYTVLSRNALFNSEKGAGLVIGIGQQGGSINTMTPDDVIVFETYDSTLGAFVTDVVYKISDLTLLPKGVSFSSQGFLYGTPLDAGTFEFDVVATLTSGTCSIGCTYIVNPIQAVLHDYLHDPYRHAFQSAPTVSIVYPTQGQSFPLSGEDPGVADLRGAHQVLAAYLDSDIYDIVEWRWTLIVPDVTDPNGLAHITIAPGDSGNPGNTPNFDWYYKNPYPKDVTATFQVEAIDSYGLRSGVAAHTILIKGRTMSNPVVTITSPQPGTYPTPYTFNLRGSATDADGAAYGETLTYQWVTQPVADDGGGGIVTSTDDSVLGVTITNSNPYTITRTYVLTVTDSYGLSGTASVTVQVSRPASGGFLTASAKYEATGIPDTVESFTDGTTADDELAV